MRVEHYPRNKLPRALFIRRKNFWGDNFGSYGIASRGGWAAKVVA